MSKVFIAFDRLEVQRHGALSARLLENRLQVNAALYSHELMGTIGIRRQDEDGQVEAAFDDPRVMNHLLDGPPPGTYCLQFIDPVGDTVFNRLQLPLLIDELRAHAQGRSPELHARVEALIAFIQPAIDEPHLYIKFVGD